MTRYTLPTTDDLTRLGSPQIHAITIYAQTSPAPDQRETSFLNAKSAFDSSLKQIREKAVLTHAQESALRAQWNAVAEDPLWSNLSRSLAIFINDTDSEVYVLPNSLENQSQAGSYFDIGQLLRAATGNQFAYALTLSANGWNLWEATPTARAQEMKLSEEYAADAAEATNRATIRGRQHIQRLVGDEGKKVLLEKYAKRVHEAVEVELRLVDPAGQRPLYLFATDPLMDMFGNLERSREIVAVPGAPDELRADQIDDAIRESLDELNARRNTELVNRIGNDVGRGLVATDIGDIARASVQGAIACLVYSFTDDVLGRLDETTGQVTYDDDGYDLLSRIATIVLDRGGDTVAVRPDEITSEVWNRVAVASLRYPLTQ